MASLVLLSIMAFVGAAVTYTPSDRSVAFTLFSVCVGALSVSAAYEMGVIQ